MNSPLENQGIADVIRTAHSEWDGFNLDDLATRVVDRGILGKNVDVPEIAARLAEKLREMRVKVIHHFPSRDGLEPPELRPRDIESITGYLLAEMRRIDMKV